MTQCAIRVEHALKHVLNAAEACNPEIAVVVAHALTKLTLDIGAAPIVFADRVHADGEDMRDILRIQSFILKKAKPDRVDSFEDLKEALKLTSEACKERKSSDKLDVLFGLLVREISRVFRELRSILKRHKTPQTKHLFHVVQKYLRVIADDILCFSYNSMKLEVCMHSIDSCGPKSGVDKKSLRCVMSNVAKLMKQARTLTVLNSRHHEVMEKASSMAQNSDLF